MTESVKQIYSNNPSCPDRDGVSGIALKAVCQACGAATAFERHQGEGGVRAVHYCIFIQFYLKHPQPPMDSISPVQADSLHWRLPIHKETSA